LGLHTGPTPSGLVPDAKEGGHSRTKTANGGEEEPNHIIMFIYKVLFAKSEDWIVILMSALPSLYLYTHSFNKAVFGPLDALFRKNN
jgi:hypothetical protein